MLTLGFSAYSLMVLPVVKGGVRYVYGSIGKYNVWLSDFPNLSRRIGMI